LAGVPVTIRRCCWPTTVHARLPGVDEPQAEQAPAAG
jgi:hypothetical protein